MDCGKPNDEGNREYRPPFVGYAYQSAGQKEDLSNVIGDGTKNVDYVACWYYVAARLINNTKIKAAFVSTNSITQGEQVAAVWKPLYEKFGTEINFAHTTFRWDSEASIKAHVHCVIVGFTSGAESGKKMLFTSDSGGEAKNINFYLLDAPNVFLEKRMRPICNVTEIIRGSSPNDDGKRLHPKEAKVLLLACKCRTIRDKKLPYFDEKDRSSKGVQRKKQAKENS